MAHTHPRFAGFRAALVSLGFLVGQGSHASAAADILNVPVDFPTIQAAIDAAQIGDEIVLAPGIYENPSIEIGGSRPLTITIRSTDPADPEVVAQTVLVDPEDERILDIIAIEPVGVTLDGLTVRRAAVRTDDSTIRVVGADIAIKRCVFDGGTEATGRIGTILETFEIATTKQIAPMTVRLEDLTVLGRVGDFDIFATEVIVDGFDSAVPNASGRLTIDGSGEDQLIEIRNSWFTIPVILTDESPDGSLITDTTFADVDVQALQARSNLRLERVEFIRLGQQPGFSSRVVEIAGSLTATDIALRDSGNDENTVILFQVNRSAAIDGFHIAGNTAIGILVHIEGLNAAPGTETADLRNITAIDNIAPSGVVEWHNSGTIRDSEFRRNEGPPLALFGRGILINNASILVERCTFAHNLPSSDNINLRSTIGSFLPFADSRIRVAESVFIANRANDAGVVGFPRISANNGSGPSVVFEQCLIVGNTGGEAAVHYGEATYINCVIIDNTALDGSTRLGRGSAELINTVFVDRSPDAPAIAEVPTDLGPVTLTVANSIVRPVNFGLGSSSLDPLFIRPPSDGGDGWGDDPDTPHIDESLNDDFGDLRLQPGSPAIDRVDASAIDPSATDLDGNPRVADDAGVPNAANITLDLGAYEFQGTSCLADVNQNGVLDPGDFTAWVAAFNAGTARADQNRSGAVDPGDFTRWIANYNAGCP